MNLAVILGTAREGRRSEQVAKLVFDRVKKASCKVDLLDVRDYRLPATDRIGRSAEAKKYKKKIAKSDAIIIVSPEYNHSFPGELKMMLDLLYLEYNNKVVGICAVSDGNLGGVLVANQLRNLCNNFNMRAPMRTTVYFPNVDQLFDGQGVLQDHDYIKRVDKMIDVIKIMVDSNK